MSFGPLLSFKKYASQVDAAFLADYLKCLPSLHPTYQGLLLPSSPEPKQGGDTAEELYALIENGAGARRGAVCQHKAAVNARCDGFDWRLNFERFSIRGSAFNDVIGTRLNEDDSFVSAYGTEEASMSLPASHWIEQGFCDTVSDLGSLLLEKSTAWKVYLSAKDQYRYPSNTRLYHCLLDHWGEYQNSKRVQAAEFLDALRPRVLSYHSGLFAGNPLNREVQADYRTFVRYADERLIRDLGEKTFSTMLSVFEISIDQWQQAGEPKPANYSAGGIWTPSPA